MDLSGRTPDERPNLTIRVNGTSLPPGALADLRSIQVLDDLDALSMFTIELQNWDPELRRYTWSDDRTFAVGNEVAISVGSLDQVKQVMVGEVTSLEPTWAGTEPPVVTVRGYDQRHRLGRGRRTRTFSRMKDSAIAQQVAVGAGLRAQVTDTKQIIEHVTQSNQSDLEFLRSRARLIGYEVFVRDRTLHFAPPGHAAPPALVLELGVDIEDFSPRLSALGQVGGTTVRGWNPKTKSAVVSSARTDSTMMGGKAAGSKTSDRAFGSSDLTIAQIPVADRPRADQLARGGFVEIGLSYIEGEAEGPGRAGLQAGQVVAVRGAGTTFSGAYYVTSVTHSFTPEDGFRTAFTFRRNAA